MRRHPRVLDCLRDLLTALVTALLLAGCATQEACWSPWEEEEAPLAGAAARPAVPPPELPPGPPLSHLPASAPRWSVAAGVRR